MPKGLRTAIVEYKGLPTDEEIRSWRDRLLLCKSALEAEQAYDRYLEAHDAGLDLNSDEGEAFLNAQAATVKPYQDAIDALNKLIEKSI